MLKVDNPNPTEMTGVVKKVTVSNPSNGTDTAIIIINGKSGEEAFSVTSATKINDADSKGISLDKIRKGHTVKIIYDKTEREAREAVSITVTK